MSELVWGIKNGELDQVREIVEKKGINVNEMVDGRAPIHYAADYGQKEVLEYLISKGADVNVQAHGVSALLAAIWEGHKDCVKILVEKGALKDGRTPDGNTYLEATENEDIRALLR